MSDVRPLNVNLNSAAEDTAGLQALEFVKAASLSGFQLTFELTSCPGENYIVVLPEDYPRGEPILLPGDVLRSRRVPDIVREVYERDCTSASEGLSQDDVDDAGFGFQEPDSGNFLDKDIGLLKTFLSSHFWVTVEDVKLLGISESLVVLSLFLREQLSPLAAAAWGFDLNAPLVVRLSINRKLYPGTGAIEVDCYQVDGSRVDCSQETRQCLLAWQLQRILREFLGLPELYGSSSSESSTVGVELGRENDVVTPDFEPPLYEYEPEVLDVSEILDLGFPFVPAVTAVNITRDFGGAVGLLLDCPDLFAEAAEAEAQAPGAAQRSSSPTIPMLKSRNLEVVKQIPVRAPEHGFLVQLVEYLLQRLPTCSEFCMICDQQHVFDTGALIKPAVCNRAFCVFRQMEIIPERLQHLVVPRDSERGEQGTTTTTTTTTFQEIRRAMKGV